MKKCFDCGASSIILIHNHPSGDPAPSENDRSITKKMIFGCNFLDISVLDHIIIGNNSYYSFHEEGIIEQYRGKVRYYYENGDE